MSISLRLEDFKTKSLLTAKGGLLKSDRFSVELILPSSSYRTVQMDRYLSSENFRYNVCAFECPGIVTEVGTQEINNHRRYFHKTRSDNQFSFTVLEDAHLNMRRAFYDWINLCINIEDRDREYFEYMKAPYLTVSAVDSNGIDSLNYDYFEDVIPISIDALSYSMETDQQILKTKVNFAYKFHSIKTRQGGAD